MFRPSYRQILPVTRSKTILVVLHQQSSSPGRVAQLLQARGYHLDIRRPVLGQRLPDSLSHHDGVIIFGGPMSVNHPDLFLKHEIEWIKVVLDEKKPFLGICLGAQMLAKQLGASVRTNPKNLVEMGWYRLEATSLGHEILDWPKKVYHFHNEGIYDLPRSAEVLATGETFPTQAFRFNEKAWGIQFHAELTLAMMHQWVIRGADHLTAKGAHPGQTHLKDRFLYDPALVLWLINTLDLLFD